LLILGVVLKILDRVLSCLLILGGVGHTFGSLQFYKNDQMTLFWALSDSLFIFLLGTLNFVRAGRERDVAITWLCLVGGICHIVASLQFGFLIGNFFDFRPVIFVVITVGLCAMCVRTLVSE
jgi:hypothetical protein